MQKGMAAVLVAVIVIALAVAGCGSSREDVTVAVGLTKAEFIKEGDAICRRGSEEIRSGAEALRKEDGVADGVPLTDAQEEELVAEVVVPSIQKQADGLAEIGAPEGDQDEVTAIVDGLSEIAQNGEEDPAKLLRVPKAEGPVAEVNKVAVRYGVEECSQP